MDDQPLVVRGRRRYFGKVMLTVTGDGLEHPVCGFIPPGQPLLEFPERTIGMTPEALRAEIEARAGRTWPR